MAYTEVRTDLLGGTDVASELASVKVFDGEGKPIAVENGTIVKLGEYIEGEREVRSATLAAAGDETADIALVAAPELDPDERHKSLAEFINPANVALRAYLLDGHNGYFSVTEPGFAGDAPTKTETSVGIGEGGKLDASGSGLGTVVKIEKLAKKTYYVIRLAKA